MGTAKTATLQRCETRYFGPIEYDEASVLVFPDGIPAFEQSRRFLPLRQAINEPLIFLQCLSNPDLCFVTLPTLSACPHYRLTIAREDLKALELATGRQPIIGSEVLCLTILSIEENMPPTANLLAPIVVNVHTQCARQVIQVDSAYSHREKLPIRVSPCS
jgi:flagellar assembly factor FliW